MTAFDQQICVDEDGESTWTLYDTGPRTVRCPLLFLPPVSGRADIFFQQLLALSALGYRVISVCALSVYNSADTNTVYSVRNHNS